MSAPLHTPPETASASDATGSAGPDAGGLPAPGRVPRPGVGLRSFLDAVARRVGQEPASWVRVEVIEVREKANYVRMEFAEHDGGKLVARVGGGCTPKVYQGIVGALAAAGLELRCGSVVLARLRARMSPTFGADVEVMEVDPSYTLGDARARVDAARARLVAAGVWDLNRRLPPPSDFTAVAVLSPAGAAGLGDFRATADPLAAFGLCRFDYYESPFQGPGAPARLVAALREIRARSDAGRYDAVVIIRGGGAAADFSSLSDHGVAAAVCGMPIPVVTGIGHERDRCLLDEAASVCCGTPSKAAEFVRASVISSARGAEAAITDGRAASLAALAALGAATAGAAAAVSASTRARLRRSHSDLASARSQLGSATVQALRAGRAGAAAGASAVLSASVARLQEAERRTVAAAQAARARAGATLEAAAAAGAALAASTAGRAPAILAHAGSEVAALLAASAEAAGALEGPVSRSVKEALATVGSFGATLMAGCTGEVGRCGREVAAAPHQALDTAADAVARVFAGGRGGAGTAVDAAAAAAGTMSAAAAAAAGSALDGAGRLLARRAATVADDAAEAVSGMQVVVAGASSAACALDPVNVIRLGYAVLRDEWGRPVTEVRRIGAHRPITAQLRDGSVKLQLLGMEPY